MLLECQDELRAMRRDMLEKSEQELQTQSRRILIASMQRLASKPNTDLTASLVHLPSEDMKGRLIGREGRNIKSFEAATGVTLLIDESPQLVLLSSFDPVRREIARNALEALVKDGRIHPASIEEYVKRAQDEIDLSTTQAGEDAVNKLNVNGLHPEIIKLLGKLRYRFSYNQNVLDHSVETAFLASLIASEIGLDPNLAKRAGLLHDIGKAVSGEMEGSHAGIGAEFIKRHGETPIVVNAVAAHHEEVKPETIYAGLGHARRHDLGHPARRAGRVDGELHPEAQAPRGAGDVDRRGPAGLCDSGGPGDPRGRFAPGGDGRPGPRDREGAQAPDRGRAPVPEHDQDHRHPGVPVHRNRNLADATCAWKRTSSRSSGCWCAGST